MSTEPADANLPAAISVLLPGELLLGPRPDGRLLAMLQSQGVSAVLCLQEPTEGSAPSASVRRRLAWARVPLADGHADGVMRPRRLRQAVNQLREWRDEGRTVYVHCQLGIGRAPVVAAAYLAAVHGYPLGAALERVKAARPAASPTAQQLLVLSEFVRHARLAAE